MLLEALGPSMGELRFSPEETIAALCRTLRQAWAAPTETAQPENNKASQLAQTVHRLWHKVNQPGPEIVATRALQFAERRSASDPAHNVVVHGDPHPYNALSTPTPRIGAESGFVFVDPDGFIADPTYDLGVILRDWCPQLLAAQAPATLAQHYCHLLATGTDLDETAIWEWGYLERVSTGLYLLDLGADHLARHFLRTAEELVNH